MSGRIASLILALAFLTGQQPVRSQSKGNSNGFDLVDKTGNIHKPIVPSNTAQEEEPWHDEKI